MASAAVVSRTDTPRRVVHSPRTARLTPHSAPRTTLRLTRRGRVAIFLAALVGVGALVVGLGQGAEATSASAGSATATYVVQPGQSLWTVAQVVDPASDPRAVIERIRALNALSGSVVFPGQALIVPVVGG